MDEKTKRQFNRRTLLRAAGLTFGLTTLGGALAACGGPQPTTAPSAPPPAAKATPPPAGAQQAPAKAPAKGEPIKIGMLMAVSGVYSIMANAHIAGIKVAAKEIEDSGGVGGRGFDLIYEDDKSDPPTGLRSVQKFVERDRVAGILGPVSSAVAGAMRDPIHNGKTVTVMTQGANTDITGARCSKYLFRKTPSTAMLDYGGWIAKNLGKRAYSLTSDYAAGHQIADANNKSFEAAGGTVVGQGKVPLGTNDFSPYMGPVLDAKPDVVTGFFAGSDAVAVVKAFDQFGVKKVAKIAYPGFLTTADVLPAVGSAAEGIYGYLNFADGIDRPQFKDLEKKIKELVNQPLNVFHVNGYQAGKSLFLAMQKAGSPDADKVVAELEKLEWEGPMDKVKFEANHQAKCDMFITLFKDGKATLLDKVPGVISPEGNECKM